jgi:hypothetical protein
MPFDNPSPSELPGSPGKTGAASPAIGARGGTAHPTALKRKLTLLALIDELSALKEDDSSLHGRIRSLSMTLFTLLTHLKRALAGTKRKGKKVTVTTMQNPLVECTHGLLQIPLSKRKCTRILVSKKARLPLSVSTSKNHSHPQCGPLTPPQKRQHPDSRSLCFPNRRASTR